MSPILRQRKARFLILLLLATLTLSWVLVGSAGAEGAPYKEVPGYPKYGCYDVVVGGHGLWSGETAYPLVVDVPGPVVDAYLVWLGTEDTGAPNSPDQSDLIVNGTTVLGNQVDQMNFGPLGAPDLKWYMWRADVGPSGTNLIQTGHNRLNISGWGFIQPTATERNGASVVVVYSTGQCERPKQVDLLDNMDYFYAEFDAQGTSDVMAFTFPPAPVDRDVPIFLHYAGTDKNRNCRPENVWALVGSGTPPTKIVENTPIPAIGVNGGRKALENPFVSSDCGTFAFHAPASDLYGWVAGQGWTRYTSGYLAPEWSIVKAYFHVPAGATFIALQGESPKDGQLPGESGAWFAQAAIPLYDPELKITKTDGVTDANPGDTLTYTLSYENYGYNAADNTTIVDKLPEHVTYVNASNGGVYNSASNSVTWNLGSVSIGQKGQVTVVVKLDPVFEAGTTVLTNGATISTTTPGELDLSDNTASDTTNVFAKVELSIAKTAAPEPVDAGANLTYTVNWTVGGNAYAHGVKIMDTLPTGVTCVSASDSGVCDDATKTVTWNLGDVTPVKSGAYTVVVAVASPQYNGTKLTNKVAISDNAGDKAEASVVSTIRSSHTLSIEKLAAPEPVDAGSNLTYTVNWAVTGNEPAKDAKIVDTLPAGVVFVSTSGGGAYDSATNTVTWNLGEVMTPKNGSFTVVVTVPSPQYNGTQLTNKVNFSDQTPGSTPVEATVVSTVRADHQLVISKDDSPDPVEKGKNLTYTINWSVTGNEPADNVVVSDPLPFGTRFVSATDGGAYDSATNTVTWNLGNKVPGDAGSLTLVVVVNADFPNKLDISNWVTIKDNTPGKEKTAEAITKVVQTPEGAIGDTVWLDLDKDGVQGPGETGIANVGLVLYDAGPDGLCGTADDTAVANTVTDPSGKYRFDMVPAGVYCVKVLDATLPAGLVLVSGANPHGPITLAEGEQYMKADFGYLPDASKGAIGDRVWSDVNGNGVQDPGEIGLGGVQVALFTAGSDGQCGTADDVSVATTTTAADGSYLFSGLLPGAYCVKATDPAGLTLTTPANPIGPINLVAGQTYLDADFGYKGNYTGSIGDLLFYDGNRNGIYEPGPVERGIAGVTVSLLGPGADGQFGTADDVTIATTVTAADGSYLFTGLPDGQYQVVVTDLAGRLIGYTQTYGVPNTNNNGQVSPFDVTISGGNSVLYADFGYADGHLLNISKSHNLPAGTPVEAGAEMIYTIEYGVTGREPAPNVVIKDPLPLALDFVSASNGGVYDPVTRLVSWNLGTLDPGTTGSVTLTVKVKKPWTNNSFIYNTVTIVDDAKVMDQATDIVRVHAEPILTLTKTVTPTGTVKPGDVLEYKLCFGNIGNGNATGVLLTDPIPARTTYVEGSAPAGVIYDPTTRTLALPIGTLPPDMGTCGTFQVKVDLTLSGVTEEPQAWTVDNVATLISNEKAPLTASTSNPLNAFVKPTLTKTADPAGEVKPGDTITYEMCYANQGTANLTGVKLTDPIPANTTYVDGSATGTGITYDLGAKTLTWNIGVLGPGASACVTFKVTVNMTIDGLAGQSVMTFSEWNTLSITNTATLKNDQVGDKTATAINPLNATVDPKIYKSVDNPIRHTGETVVFTVTVKNEGTANATNVVLSDVIHPKLDEVTLTSSKGTASYDSATREWKVEVGVLAPNETVTVVITGKAARVPAGDLPYTITNSAVVSFKEGAARQSNEVVVQVVYFTPGEVPEPATLLMLGTGLAGLAGYAQLRVRSRRRK